MFTKLFSKDTLTLSPSLLRREHEKTARLYLKKLNILTDNVGTPYIIHSAAYTYSLPFSMKNLMISAKLTTPTGFISSSTTNTL